MQKKSQVRILFMLSAGYIQYKAIEIALRSVPALFSAGVRVPFSVTPALVKIESKIRVKMKISFLVIGFIVPCFKKFKYVCGKFIFLFRHGSAFFVSITG